MKKKYRNITVDGKEYAWSVSRPNCDGDWNNLLTIWFNKEILYRDVINGSIKVTPAYVKVFILDKLN